MTFVKEDTATVASLTTTTHRLIDFLELFQKVILKTIIINIISFFKKHLFLIIFVTFNIWA